MKTQETMNNNILNNMPRNFDETQSFIEMLSYKNFDVDNLSQEFRSIETLLQQVINKIRNTGKCTLNLQPTQIISTNTTTYNIVGINVKSWHCKGLHQDRPEILAYTDDNYELQTIQIPYELKFVKAISQIVNKYIESQK